jgi:hypothetical protein
MTDLHESDSDPVSLLQPPPSPSTPLPGQRPPTGRPSLPSEPYLPDLVGRARGRTGLWWLPGLITIITIGAVIAVTLSQLHPSLLITNTTTTGGDTGAHIAMPKYLETLLKQGHITGWDPGWYDGFPLYTFYFTIPDLFIAIGGWIIPYDIAFKFGTILGSLILPICAWASGRFFRLRAPIPTIMAAVTLPFLFDYTFTIYGGNLFSTLAGEYAYSFSLSLAVLFLGMFACSVREGRYRGWTAVVLAVLTLSHIVGAMYALGGAAIITAVELLPSRWGIRDDAPLRLGGGPAFGAVPRLRTLWWAVSTVLIGILLTGFWLGPFGLEHAYSVSMGYTNVEGWAQYFREADTWALALAGCGVIGAVVVRSRFGICIALLGIASGIATAIDPQGSLYNVRLLPLWFLSVYLLAAWAAGAAFIGCATWFRRWRLRRWEEATAPPPLPAFIEPTGSVDPAFETIAASDVDGGHADERASEPVPLQQPYVDFLTPRRKPSPRFKPAAISGAILGLLGALLVVVPPFVFQPSSLIHVGPNEVANWSNYNYTGYEGQSSYPEYRSIMLTMDAVSKKYGCGRDMWEYSASENRFGTPEALMLLPYWTDGCIDSMEGLLFESSATTPYHFMNQAELSAGPSEPMVGLPYGPLDVTLGVQHLQLLGVKYFMAETPTVEAEANADPALRLVAKTGPWTYDYNGVDTHTTWDIYVVRDSTLVTPLHNEPNVMSGVKAACGCGGATLVPTDWLSPSLAWYDDPQKWDVELAQSGPASWPRTSVSDVSPTTKAVAATTVSHIADTNSTVSFHVSRVGTPVLVKVSYFPNWHVRGAEGPYRVTPNLMVVVPTSHNVELSYGATSSNYLGIAATVVGLVGLVGIFAWPRLRRRRSSKPAHAASS